MFKSKRFLFFFFCLIFGTSASGLTQETSRTVEIKSLQGRVKMKAAISETEIFAKVGMFLTEGDNISVSPNSWIILEFEDGSSVEVKENSVLSIKKMVLLESQKRQETQLLLWLGELKVLMKKLPPGDKFQIYTPTAICSIRGTEFSVLVDKIGETIVSTLKGIVGVKEISGLGEEVLVKEGMQSIVKSSTPPTVPQPISPPKSETLPQEPKEGVIASYPSLSEETSISSPALSQEQDVELEPEELASSQEQDTEPELEKESVPSPEPEKKLEPDIESAPPKREEEKEALGFNMSGALGATVLTDPDTNEQKVYYKFSFLPELSIGKFGIGWDIVFYFDENNKLRDIDWDDASDIIDKVWFVRYGHKGEPVFIYLGGFREVSLGHGLIMNRYSNMLQYPDLKKIGAELDLDLGWSGFESIMSDVDNNGFYGGRLFVRPLYSSSIPLLRKVALGASAVTDQNPDLNKDTKNDEVTISGVDVNIPVFENSLFSIIAYVDGAQMNIGEQYTTAGSKNKGTGWGYGIMGKLEEINLNYRGEYRRLDNNFIPSYFDSYYEIDRSTKCFTVSSTSKPIKEGPFLEVTYTLLNALGTSLSYEDYNVPKNDPNYPHVHGELKVDPVLLMNKWSLLLTYDKRDVEKWNDLTKVKGPNTIIKTEIGYFVDPHVCLTIIYKESFDRYGNPTKNTSIETRIQF